MPWLRLAPVESYVHDAFIQPSKLCFKYNRYCLD